MSAQALVGHDGDLPDIRALRLCRGPRIEQVTGQVSVSRATYLRWEAGEWARLPSANTLSALARAFREPRAVIVAAFEEARRARNAHRPEPRELSTS